MKDNDIIYQIFVRNYSQEGTFNKVKGDLRRLKEMNISIIYLMPIHLIGEKNRKGTYGSPYAIKDYYSISPDLGTKEDLIDLINEVHRLDMKIILDMVFNHTSPDNILLKDHEDYYYHKNGKLGNRVGDWSDIINLDTSKIETQNYLIDVLKYYVNLGIDGFRFDVASLIDKRLFVKARELLGKDIIFIGESIDDGFVKYLKEIGINPTPDNEMYPTFDSLYNYNYFRIFQRYLNHQASIKELVKAINEDNLNLRLLCLENHDNERILSILDKDKLIKWLDFFSFIKGQVFIYAGQEYGLKHKPELFEKDPIDLSDIDIDIFNIYKDYINRKLNQKQIVYQHIDVINENTVKVSIKYINNESVTKLFELPNK